MRTKPTTRESLAVTIQGVRATMLMTEYLLKRWERERQGKEVVTRQEV